MNVREAPIYIIGSHGCSLKAFYRVEIEEEFNEKNYFIVPENMMIIFFNSNGVESEGSKNIPFIKNLYDTDKELFYYLIDPSNYGINLDKTNPQSYRNPYFFRSLPFFSNFNYLCNFEIYPPGVPCPLVYLSFTIPTILTGKPSYFEGMTKLENIVYKEFGKPLEFVDESKVDPIYTELPEKDEGWIYTNKLFTDFLPRKYINHGIFFISACRADYFKTPEHTEIIGIHPIERNCGDIAFDLSVIDKLKAENPDSSKKLDIIKIKFERRYNIKLQIDEIIKKTFPQNAAFFNNHFLERLYHFIILESGTVNIVVNFVKININCLLPEERTTVDRLKLIDTKFSALRGNITRIPTRENINYELYRKLGQLYRLFFYFLKKTNTLPDPTIYNDFWDIINRQDLNKKDEEIYANINSEIQPKYNLLIRGGNYEEKYKKYKQKYLMLKNKIT